MFLYYILTNLHILTTRKKFILHQSPAKIFFFFLNKEYTTGTTNTEE